ncbi:oligosaccharide flippase family protein [Paracoccus sp. MBLB3053]|uniref:Oligosaccharide flippase family protein n=1 Tax=Paracoccus aurantius TaxID=3073814 RepID=A0ABU2HWF2_9RHOB|nr:oligosaccharide flippase family protein [Paracoccus sp. MBLB3053]MDS9468924.1 oligosaccharide flippase family protein [Paracoccus sp. MBLB3053]
MTSLANEAPDGARRLIGRTAVGTAWILIARIAARFSDFILLIVLTRLLSPADFGLVAIAASVVAILDVVTNLPMVTPLVRLEHVEKRHLDTAFTLGLIRGLIILALIGLLAIPIARFYGDPRLSSLLIVLSLSTVVRGLQSPNMARLFKTLQYRQTFVIEIVGKCLGVAAAIGFGLATGSYWALVVSPIVSRIVGLPISYLYAPYRPALCLSEIRYFWDFLGWLFPSQIIVAASWQFDRLFLGHFVAPATLGLYSVASNLTSIIEQSIRTSVTNPLISGFVLAGSERERLQRGYVIADNAILISAIPAYLILFFFAEPLVLLAFGENWLSVVPLLKWLALAQVPALFRIPFRPLAMAVGRTDYVFIVSVCSLLLRIPAVAVGWFVAGIEGVIFGIGISAVLVAAVAMFYIRRITKISLTKQLAGSWRILSATVPAALIAWPATVVLHGLTGLTLAVALAGACLAVSIVYFGTIFLLWYSSGLPDGVEAKIMVQLRALLRKARVGAR